MAEANVPGLAEVVVVDLAAGRQISAARLPERLSDRSAEIGTAIQEGVKAVLDGVRGEMGNSSWRADELCASFAITLKAETGVIISKAAASATLEVSVVFRKRPGDSDASRSD